MFIRSTAEVTAAIDREELNNESLQHVQRPQPSFISKPDDALLSAAFSQWQIATAERLIDLMVTVSRRTPDDNTCKEGKIA